MSAGVIVRSICSAVRRGPAGSSPNSLVGHRAAHASLTTISEKFVQMRNGINNGD